MLLQMGPSDLDEVASLVLERLSAESSTAVVCGSDMVKKLEPLKIIALRFFISSERLLFSSNAFEHIDIALGSCIPDSRRVDIRHRNNGMSLMRSSLLRSTSVLISHPPSTIIAAVNPSEKRGFLSRVMRIAVDKKQETVPVISCFFRYCS